jgi:hypothetical protein
MGWPDLQGREVLGLDAALDDHLAGQLDVAQGVGAEALLVVGAGVRRRLGPEALHGERPQPPLRRQAHALVVRRLRSVRGREDHAAVGLAARADQVRDPVLLLEQALRDGRQRHPVVLPKSIFPHIDHDDYKSL